MIFRALALSFATASLATAQTTSILSSKHNLSVSGPGQFRAESQAEVCIFCHAPHNATVTTPLWNREDSRATYLTYQSSTFEGTISQPNGSTKRCLSCHDGTVALGKVVSLGQQEIALQNGRRFLDSGPALLGTNLRDDHPVSFHYDSSRGGTSAEFVPSTSIPHPVQLDATGQMQCTSCHDAHDDSKGYFLRQTQLQGQLCTSCHAPEGWATSSHKTSVATWTGSGPDPWPHSDYTNVRDNACANCHVPHNAGQPERLLQAINEDDTCLRCHSGTVAQKNVGNDILKVSAHDVRDTTGVHDPAEDPMAMTRHVECMDCHNPHAARSGTAPAPGVPGPITQVSGITTTGARTENIQFGYELCYKCHADANGGTANVPRQIQQTNVRLEFQPSNPSFHPIESVGRNPDVPSLISPWTPSSRVGCTDCHQSDSSPDAGGSGARGPHGSNFSPLLIANYSTVDNQTESAARYSLCYRCHSRSSILGDNSFKEHRKHIVEERAACSACHDSHGISASQGTPTNNSHLINFDTRVVTPRNGVMRFVDQGRYRGNCTLVCHGQNHDNEDY